MLWKPSDFNKSIAHQTDLYRIEIPIFPSYDHVRLKT